MGGLGGTAAAAAAAGKDAFSFLLGRRCHTIHTLDTCSQFLYMYNTCIMEIHLYVCTCTLYII